MQRLSRPGDEWSLASLAKQFGVSERTIRNDIKSLNHFLGKEGLGQLEFLRGGVIRRPEDFSQAMGRLPVRDTFAYKMSSEERKELGTAILVGSMDYVTLAEIAKRFSVSRATVLNDLDGIKALVVKAGLRVVSKSSHGLMVEGPEELRRVFLTGFICRHTPVVDQWMHFPENEHVKEDAIVIRKILNEQCHAHGINMPDQSFGIIASHLCIAVDRVRKGAALEGRQGCAGETAKTCATGHGFERSVIELVTQYCNVSLGRGEVEALAALKRTLRYHNELHINIDTMQIQKVSRAFIRRMSHEIGIDLNHDYDLFEYLSNHLESMFSTEPSRFPQSPDLEEVINDYPEVIDAVRRNLSPLEGYARRTITDVEILYVALHICAALERRKNRGVRPRVVVVCDGGIGTSQLLAEDLQGHFDIRIVKVMPAHDVPYIETYQADLVISTVPLDNCPVEHIVIRLPLTDRAYQGIHAKLSSIESTVRLLDTNPEHFSAQELLDRLEPIMRWRVPDDDCLMQEVRLEVRRFFREAQQLEDQIIAPYLHQLLPASHIRKGVACENWRSAIRASAQPLLEMGYIEPRYVDAMIRGAEEHGPYMALAPGFAIPHSSPEDGAIKMGMSLVRLETPVAFGSEGNDPIEFVCTLSAVDAKMHLRAFADLLDMLFRPEVDFVAQLRRAQTPEEMAAVIERCEYRVIQ